MARRLTASALTPDVVSERVRTLPKRLRKENADGLVAEWELRLDNQPFAISIGNHSCTVREGPHPKAHSFVRSDAATWLAIDEGSITGPQAFMDRRVSVGGNLDLAVRLQTLFRPYKRARKATDLDQIEVDADGVRLSTYVIGKGSPLVLLHGMGASKLSWVPLLTALSDSHRVIAPDLPGHGDSDKPVGDYSPRFYARVVRHFLDAMDVEQAVIVGNSMGGRVGVELALRSPNRVSALVLLCAAAPGLRWRYLLSFTRVFPSEVAGIPFPLREWWMERVLRGLFGRPRELAVDVAPLAAREFIRVHRDPRARVAFLSSLRHVVTESKAPFWAGLRRVKQPALVIVGDQDRLVPARLGIRLAHSLPSSELLLLPGIGHIPQFEATEETLAAIERFLSTVE
jgi:pimeloyl-ACP methyl ester carboxylesterase/putative sterol carrier protein